MWLCVTSRDHALPFYSCAGAQSTSLPGSPPFPRSPVIESSEPETSVSAAPLAELRVSPTAEQATALCGNSGGDNDDALPLDAEMNVEVSHEAGVVLNIKLMAMRMMPATCVDVGERCMDTQMI